MATTTKTATRYLLGTCTCGRTTRREATVTTIYAQAPGSIYRRAVGEQVSFEGCRATIGGALATRCACGLDVTLRAVRAKVTETKCGTRCRTSKRHDCECACGGANHGVDC